MKIQPLDLDHVFISPFHDEPGFGSLETAQGHLPLEAMDIQTQVAATVAYTTLSQVFCNTYNSPLEATYIFPLPPRAAVSKFVMTVGDRRIEGTLDERGAARKTYDQAIAKGHRAAIAEQERSDVFTMRVGNIPPNEKIKVELVMTAPLEVVEGEVTYRFPLVVAPRYIPGNPLRGQNAGLGTHADTDAVPDASRITPPTLLPNYPNPVQLSLEVQIDTGGPALEDLRSTLHSTMVECSNEHAHVRLAHGEQMDRDFILRWRIASEKINTSALLSPSPREGEKILQVTLTPPIQEIRDRKARDVIFVLDRSGSMSGWKMIAARRSVGRMIDSLSKDDCFNILAFDNRIETMPTHQASDLIEASNKNRWRSIEWLSGIDARGGTEMARPLERAATALSGGYQDRERWIVLVTDGQVGNEDQILSHLSSNLRNVRVFSVGIDTAVNAGFLRRLGSIGNGGCELVESEERLDEVMERVHHAIDTPVLSQVSISFEGHDITQLNQIPETMTGLYPGTTLTLSARVKGDLSGPLYATIKGQTALGDDWTQKVQVQRSPNPAPAMMWAKERLQILEDRFAIGRGSKGALKDEMVKISLAYNVLCKFTSFVAVDHAEVIENQGPLRQVVQPVASQSKERSRAAKPRSAPAPQSAPFEAKRDEYRSTPLPPAPASPSFGTQALGAQQPEGTAAIPGSVGTRRAKAEVPSQAVSHGHFESQVFDDSLLKEADEEVAMSAAPSFEEYPKGMLPNIAITELPPQPAKRGERLEPKEQPATVTKNRPRYTYSIEEVRGMDPNKASDVWNLAVLLYQMLEGKLLFHGSSEYDMISNIMGANYPSPLLSDATQTELAALLLSMLDPTPSKRPSMAQVVAELGRLFPNLEQAKATLRGVVGGLDKVETSESLASPRTSSRFNVLELLRVDDISGYWRAQDIESGSEVMVRGLRDNTFRPEGYADDAVIAIFEGQIFPKVSHSPSFVAKSQGPYSANEEVYNVSTFVDGVTLRRLLKEKPGNKLSLEVAVSIALQTAAIMDEAHSLSGPHSKGLMHGRLTPLTVWVDVHGEVHVIDFGADAA